MIVKFYPQGSPRPLTARLPHVFVRFTHLFALMSVLAVALLICSSTACAQVTLAPGASVSAVFPGSATSTLADLVAAGDFNGDGVNDLALGQNNSCQGFGCPFIAPQSPGGTSLLLDDGSRAFPTQVPTSPTAWANRAIASFDYDNDGDTDLITLGSQAGQGGIGAQLCLLLHDGVGGFAPPIFTAAPYFAERLVLGDINGDGLTDVTVWGGTGSLFQAEVFLSNGVVGFVGTAPFALPSAPAALSISDLDNDGLCDIVSGTLDGFAVLPAIGGGAIGALETFSVPGAFGITTLVKTIDYNLDGLCDIITGHQGFASAQVFVHYALPGGGYDIPTALPLPPATQEISGFEVADLDGDGDLDIALAWSSGGSFYAGAIEMVRGQARDAVELPMPGRANLTLLPQPDSPLVHLACSIRTASLVEVLENTTPHVTLNATPTRGTTLPFVLNAVEAPLENYAAAISGSRNSGIAFVDGRVLDLDIDFLFLFSLTAGNGIFPNALGTLDALGEAQVPLLVPNFPLLSGVPIHIAFVIFDPPSPAGIGSVSPALTVTLQ